LHFGNVNKAKIERNQGKHIKFKVKHFTKTNSLQIYVSFLNDESNFFKSNNASLYKYLFVLRFSIICAQRRGGTSKIRVKNNDRVRGAEVSGECIKHKLIRLSLILGGVHPNPGPEDGQNREGSVVPDLAFLTFNCRGLNDVAKLRRLLVKLNALVKKNYIIALQETHKINIRTLETYWKNKYIVNCNSTNKKGVVILFNNEYSVNHVYKDEEDRVIIAELESEKTKVIIGNVYYPNDHNEAIVFSENMYSQIMEFQYRSVDAYTCVMGDMNQCLNEEDSVNRIGSLKEKELAKLTISNNETCNLVDSYRVCERVGGFTWKRGNCYSRLDYILISDELQEKIVKVGLDWCLEKSDHAAVLCNIKLTNNIKKGGGIVRLNSDILKNPDTVKEVGRQLKEYLDQAPEEWNPHTKLEYMKVGIRTVVAGVTGVMNKYKKDTIKDIEDQINRINKVREDEIGKTSPDERLLEKINEANEELSSELDILRAKYSEDLAFKSGVRWYEEGEKSNKYFLGLMKVRSRQKIISEIGNGGQRQGTQSGIMNCIRLFYEELYSKREAVREEMVNRDFFKLCPKLSEQSRVDIDREITLNELSDTLVGCKETAPGPDGITYNFYRKLWPIVGHIILESWKFSVDTGILPPSHLDSALTLIPKDGKDGREIKNWRPITLTNCDAKIITKALANRMSKHIDSIVDQSQTAYVPGRSVMDNIRCNMFLKDYCKKNKIDGVLTSLDAKKAFDSVSHEYIGKILEAYGFGENFKKYFKTLYNKITVRVLVNGHFSDKIKIGRGVKQGDALSCSLFILCVDPLLRNINANDKIKEIKIAGKLTGVKVKFKASGYADDISIICKNSRESLQEIFNEYEKLTLASGLELNAEKTEILGLGSLENIEIFHEIRYCNATFKIKTVQELKICGIYFSNDKSDEYDHNILSKIEKLEMQLKKWKCRNLTMEGKILIVKTFGLSQIIYSLQSQEMLDRDIKLVERLIFKFIWCKEWGKVRWTERVSRKVLKGEYEDGGLKAPDIESLNKALKLRQYIRSWGSKHAISNIQQIRAERVNSAVSKISQEYDILDQLEQVAYSSQKTINQLTDSLRNEISTNINLGETSLITINMMGSINVSSYLIRRNELVANGFFNTFKREGIETLGDLVQEIEYTTDSNRLESLRHIENKFPEHILNAARNYCPEINENVGLTHIYLGNDLFIPINEVTVKQLQLVLKRVLAKVESPDYCSKLNIEEFDKSQIVTVRKQIVSVQLRNIFYRLINKDFFTGERMLRFKMVDSDRCKQCNEVETFKHLLWECECTKVTWRNFNTILRNRGMEKEGIHSYSDLFSFSSSAATTTIRLRIINHFIQINRQTKLSEERILNIIREIMTKEKYIASKNNRQYFFNKKWMKYI
jgi:exonuclease III